ncbi:urease accessory protein UreD [Listeria cornellensis]|uniref:Urease accessory protein UreD n=1 Tax=Listeria cornellensis FSL F6-0969 TaxID=1265820 RepID=W7C016_9LIST|nr:urease accessory protein UreD [Listeria cornellensis]EUJ30632.1 urease accessory protein UreD [Listeria cornellensis FSL F6-0969]
MKKNTGTLELAIAKKNGKSVPTDVYFQGALKVMRPQYLDDSGQVVYFILNPGGGYVDGDVYRIAVSVEANAELLLTTQSATKVYKTPNDIVRQETEITLGKNSLLEFISDPVIAYEGARYVQQQVVHMDETASLFYSEMITPGWAREQDGFRYEKLLLKNQVYVDGKLSIIDAFRLTPASGLLHGIGMLEDHSHVGSLLVVTPGVDESFMLDLQNDLKQAFPILRFGVSLLNVSGFSARILANTTQELERFIAHCHQYIRAHCFEKSPLLLRKY